ncbi:MAG: NADH-quinone oxidoreductase subunit C [Alphaproteobacteria bacterium]|nr:NADH-quinone oxidoreductase subunit C [Alphaproteobacteria bacterium]MDE2335982.1 NADH-quinone oxidoreductase subunit C [Alphaproteobacteria bacterium]
MTETLKALGDHIAGARGDAVIKRDIALDELVFAVRRDAAHDFISFLKSDEKCACQQLMNLSGADYPDRAERFDVVYNLLSLTHNHRIRVVVMAGEDQAVDSVTDLYSAAGWYEREVWDLYGVPFKKHPDMRRILTDYGFEGHPLRKDFPLTGFVELRYDEEKQRIVQEPVVLTQDYRNFDFVSPWEGMTTVQLPGDEKAAKQKVGAK